MSLIYCRSCSGILSEGDARCPHCGAFSPKRKSSRVTGILFSMSIVILITGIALSGLTPVLELAATPLSKQQKSQQESLLVSELKSIPVQEIYTNIHMYKTLMDLDPSNLRYIKKHTYYAIKVKELEQKIGERPVINDLDGIPSAIRVFVKKRVKDRRSVHFKSCSNMSFSDAGWVISCKYSGGSMADVNVLKDYRFTLRHNSVVTTTKIF